MEPDNEKRFDKLFTVYGAVIGEKGKLNIDCIQKWFADSEITGRKFDIDENVLKSVFEKIDKEKKGLDMGKFRQFIKTLGKEKKADEKDIIDGLLKVGRIHVQMPEVPSGNSEEEEKLKDKLFESLFEVFVAAREGDGKLDEEGIQLWFKAGNVKIEEKDLQEEYEKLDKSKKGLSFDQFNELVEALGKKDGKDSKDIHETLVGVQTVTVDMPKRVRPGEKKNSKDKKKGSKDEKKDSGGGGILGGLFGGKKDKDKDDKKKDDKKEDDKKKDDKKEDDKKKDDKNEDDKKKDDKKEDDKKNDDKKEDDKKKDDEKKPDDTKGDDEKPEDKKDDKKPEDKKDDDKKPDDKKDNEKKPEEEDENKIEDMKPEEDK